MIILTLQEKVTKQTLIEQALNEQLKERQEMERKLQKLAKTMDYLERAKREEEAPLIEAAYQKHLLDDEIFFTQQQQVSMLLTLFVQTVCPTTVHLVGWSSN